MEFINFRVIVVFLVFSFVKFDACGQDKYVFKVNDVHLETFLKEAYSEKKAESIYNDPLKMEEIKNDISRVRIVRANEEFVKRFPKLKLKESKQIDSHTFKKFDPKEFNPFLYEINYNSKLKKNAYRLENTAYYIVIDTKK